MKRQPMVAILHPGADSALKHSEYSCNWYRWFCKWTGLLAALALGADGVAMEVDWPVVRESIA